MKKVNSNLTGVWQGLYSYPKYGDPVFFVATLLSHGASFSGATHEAQVGKHGAPLQVFASVDGSLLTSSVNFRKTYTGNWKHSVLYSGELSSDKNEIEGTWNIPDTWSERFLMIRSAGLGEEIVRKAFEKV